jgi:hypothetical protein
LNRIILALAVLTIVLLLSSVAVAGQQTTATYAPTAGVDEPPRQIGAVVRDTSTDAASAGTGGSTVPTTQVTATIAFTWCSEPGFTNTGDYGRCFSVPTSAQTCPAHAPYYDPQRNICYATQP